MPISTDLTGFAFGESSWDGFPDEWLPRFIDVASRQMDDFRIKALELSPQPACLRQQYVRVRLRRFRLGESSSGSEASVIVAVVVVLVIFRRRLLYAPGNQDVGDRRLEVEQAIRLAQHQLLVSGQPRVAHERHSTSGLSVLVIAPDYPVAAGAEQLEVASACSRGGTPRCQGVPGVRRRP